MSAGAIFGGFAKGLVGGLELGVKARENKGRGILDENGKLPATEMGPTMKGQEFAPAAPKVAEATPAVPAKAAAPAKPYRTADPAAADMAPHQRAFLNAIAGGESGGRYNIRYDGGAGTTFDDMSKHPAVFAPTKDGKKSSAAGRYQFTKTTWDALGGGEFSPEAQDRAAWRLATRDYKARTGRDLDADLQRNGLTDDIMGSLTPTWLALGKNRDRHSATYGDSLGRYRSTAGATPAVRGSTTTPASAGATPDAATTPPSRVASLALLGGNFA